MSEDTKSAVAETPRSAQKAPAKPEAELMSPRDHALHTGHGPPKGRGTFAATMGGRAIPVTSKPRGSVAYEVAKMAHGWAQHEHEEGKPLLMTRADFLKALEVAMTFNPKGESNTHAPALSKHKRKGA
jgi:hypothetical protein